MFQIRDTGSNRCGSYYYAKVEDDTTLERIKIECARIANESVQEKLERYKTNYAFSLFRPDPPKIRNRIQCVEYIPTVRDSDKNIISRGKIKRGGLKFWLVKSYITIKYKNGTSVTQYNYS